METLVDELNSKVAHYKATCREEDRPIAAMFELMAEVVTRMSGEPGEATSGSAGGGPDDPEVPAGQEEPPAGGDADPDPDPDPKPPGHASHKKAHHGKKR